MAMCRRLAQSLWFLSCKYQKRAFCLNIHETLKSDNQELQIEAKKGRKAFSLKEIIDMYPDLYHEITKKNMSSMDWENIRKGILQKTEVTAVAVDSIVIDLCIFHYRLDKAIEYFQFLKERDNLLNVAIIGKYLRLFTLKQPLTDADKREIVAICDGLLEKYPCLDSITAEHCIISLCLTDQWEKSYKMVNMIKLTSSPGQNVYNALASAAFRHDKPDNGWDAMEQLANNRWMPSIDTYMSYLWYCENGDQKLFDDRLERMFTYWAEHAIYPQHKVLNEYSQLANNKYNWSATPTKILMKSGQCSRCSIQLSDLTFNEDTFRELADTFMQRVIVSSDIYYKSHPQELKNFMMFIAKTKPYDIVIDGLNITYSVKQTANPQLLMKVVQYFVKRGQKVLVLTRQHQKHLHILKDIEQEALVFYTKNLSKDDPYLLYATLVSGNKAMFVSSDLMRQHKYLLEDRRLQNTFKKWQYSHQYFVKPKKKDIKIIPPLNFMPHAQMSIDGWHIPYVSDDYTYSDSYEFPNMWYCFSKKRRKK